MWSIRRMVDLPSLHQQPRWPLQDQQPLIQGLHQGVQWGVERQRQRVQSGQQRAGAKNPLLNSVGDGEKEGQRLNTQKWVDTFCPLTMEKRYPTDIPRVGIFLKDYQIGRAIWHSRFFDGFASFELPHIWNSRYFDAPNFWNSRFFWAPTYLKFPLFWCFHFLKFPLFWAPT